MRKIDIFSHPSTRTTKWSPIRLILVTYQPETSWVISTRAKHKPETLTEGPQTVIVVFAMRNVQMLSLLCVVTPVCHHASVSSRKCVVMQVLCHASILSHLCVVRPVCHLASVWSRKCVVTQVCRHVSVLSRKCVVTQVCHHASVSSRKCVVKQVYRHTSVL